MPAHRSKSESWVIMTPGDYKNKEKLKRSRATLPPPESTTKPPAVDNYMKPHWVWTPPPSDPSRSRFAYFISPHANANANNTNGPPEPPNPRIIRFKPPYNPNEFSQLHPNDAIHARQRFYPPESNNDTNMAPTLRTHTIPELSTSPRSKSEARSSNTRAQSEGMQHSSNATIIDDHPGNGVTGANNIVLVSTPAASNPENGHAVSRRIPPPPPRRMTSTPLDHMSDPNTSARGPTHRVPAHMLSPSPSLSPASQPSQLRYQYPQTRPQPPILPSPHALVQSLQAETQRLAAQLQATAFELERQKFLVETYQQQYRTEVQNSLRDKTEMIGHLHEEQRARVEAERVAFLREREIEALRLALEKVTRGQAHEEGFVAKQEPLDGEGMT